MPKTRKPEVMSFGARLAELRKAAGFTQQDLADEVGVSRRMIAYYEVQSGHPPTHLLPSIAQALNVTTDELLGAGPVKKAAQAKPRIADYSGGCNRLRSSSRMRSVRSCN